MKRVEIGGSKTLSLQYDISRVAVWFGLKVLGSFGNG